MKNTNLNCLLSGFSLNLLIFLIGPLFKPKLETTCQIVSARSNLTIRREHAILERFSR